ncbi:MAG: carboxypeptidase-like regulatory domain-containing protein [Chitinophagaceae bacterium]|nr:MAG: carboxypeptidase-like regulatory domain-containing protein [Chitinophagaceae bacterium]
MKSLFFTALCFLTITCFSQINISGKIVDERTNEGIAGASVYLNNSSCGTKTDADGKFKLSCSTMGAAEIVFSHLSYEKKIMSVLQGNEENLTVALKAKQNNLNEVVIRPKQSKADLLKWMDVFLQNFIGNYDKTSKHCKIKNAEVLYFDFDRQENKLKASAREPLLIENSHIGYKIRIELDKFEYSFNTNQVLAVYSSFYDEVPQKDTVAENQIKKNRRSYYYGSTMHFMRSLYKNKAITEGFWLFKYSAVKNQEKFRVNSIIREKTAEAYAKGTDPSTALNQFFSKDTISYYNRIMEQNDMIKIDTVPIGVTKVTSKNRTSRTINFNFQDTLLVMYQKNFPRAEPGVKIKFDPNKPTPVITPVYVSTGMTFFREGGVNIERNGYYPEMGLFMFGDMANRRFAWALPFDFNPDTP